MEKLILFSSPWSKYRRRKDQVYSFFSKYTVGQVFNFLCQRWLFASMSLFMQGMCCEIQEQVLSNLLLIILFLAMLFSHFLPNRNNNYCAILLRWLHWSYWIPFFLEKALSKGNSGSVRNSLQTLTKKGSNTAWKLCHCCCLQTGTSRSDCEVSLNVFKKRFSKCLSVYCNLPSFETCRLNILLL